MTTKSLIPTTEETALALIEERRQLIAQTAQEDRDAFTVRPPRYKLVSTAQAFQNTLNGDLIKTMTGVIIASRKVRALWPPREGDSPAEDKTPICSSNDAKMGNVANTDAFLDLTGDTDQNIFEPIPCNKCKFAEFGSGKGGRGQACKEMRRLMLVKDGSSLPAILSLPPTSIRNFDEYASGLMAEKEMYFSVRTKIAAEKASNEGGIEYSKVTFSMGDGLEPDDLRFALSLRKQFEHLAGAEVDADEIE